MGKIWYLVMYFYGYIWEMVLFIYNGVLLREFNDYRFDRDKRLSIFMKNIEVINKYILRN